MSNGFIIGLSLLSGGIMSASYLKGINNLQLAHLKHKYQLEIREINNSINEENKLISYYWNYSIITYIALITGVAFIAKSSIKN